MRVVLGLAALAMVLGTVEAQAGDMTFSCARGDTARTVSVVTAPASGYACEVQYEKTSLGQNPQVLWHADNGTSFCSDQARALVDRLSGAGWTCTRHDLATAQSDTLPQPYSVAVSVGKDGKTPAGTGVTAATGEATPPGNPAVDGSGPVDSGFQLRPTIH